MRLRLSALLACGVLSTGLTAQYPSVAPPVNNLNADPLTPAEYDLGAGDQVSIHVLDLEELSDRPNRIDARGDLSLPLVGELHAAGLTTGELQERLTQRLRAYLTEPSVTVTLTEPREQPITVLGAVNSPGIKLIRGQKNLLEAISEAGGLKPEAGAVILITRSRIAGPIPLPGAHLVASGDAYVAEVEVFSLIHAQNPRENIQLQSHDIVAVPSAGMVFVLGEVFRPGRYELTGSRTISALNAVALAGGATRNASSGRAKVLRTVAGQTDRMEFFVDLNHMLAGKEKDFQLEPQDILYIPTNKGKVITTRALEALVGTGSSIAVFRGSR